MRALVFAFALLVASPSGAEEPRTVFPASNVYQLCSGSGGVRDHCLNYISGFMGMILASDRFGRAADENGIFCWPGPQRFSEVAREAFLVWVKQDLEQRGRLEANTGLYEAWCEQFGYR